MVTIELLVDVRPDCLNKTFVKRDNRNLLRIGVSAQFSQQASIKETIEVADGDFDPNVLTFFNNCFVLSGRRIVFFLCWVFAYSSHLYQIQRWEHHVLEIVWICQSALRR